jgi:hypothetical protein
VANIVAKIEIVIDISVPDPRFFVGFHALGATAHCGLRCELFGEAK